MSGIWNRKSAWQFQLKSGLTGSMRIYPEGHAVCVIPSLVFTLRLDENYFAGIGAIGLANIKLDLMGWSTSGEFRQAVQVEYDEYTLQQLQLYMMHLGEVHFGPIQGSIRSDCVLLCCVLLIRQYKNC